MKKFAAILVTGLLFASTASAQVISNPTTNARMDGLGVSNWQIEDDFNIWINPAQITNYKNGAYIELGTDDCSRDPLVSATSGNCGNATTTNTGGNDPAIGGTGVNDRSVGAFGGLHLDASYGTWGVYVGRPYSGPLNTMEGAGSGTAPSANRFDLFYGLHGMPFGFYLSYADRSDKETPAGIPAAKDEASEINLGVGGIFGGGVIEAALNVGLPSSKCNDDGTVGGFNCGGVALPGDSTVKEDAGMNYALLVRHHAGALLTTAQIISVDASTKDSVTTTDKTDDTTLAWRIDTAEGLLSARTRHDKPGSGAGDGNQ